MTGLRITPLRNHDGEHVVRRRAPCHYTTSSCRHSRRDGRRDGACAAQPERAGRFDCTGARGRPADRLVRPAAQAPMRRQRAAGTHRRGRSA